MTSKLALENVTYRYRERGQHVLALDDINLTVNAGEFVTLIGPSGCGKSTLMRIIAGLIQPERGKIRINGKMFGRRPGRVAYMPQSDALLPWRTVLDNVLLGAEIGGQNRRAARGWALELLPMFGLDGFADVFPAQLSGGMRQRAALLRTFLIGQDILLLDEPFGALDALTRRELRDWLLEVWEHFSYTIILVTHDIDEAVHLSDRVLVMSPRPGHITDEFTVSTPRPRSHLQTETAQLEAQLLAVLERK